MKKNPELIAQTKKNFADAFCSINRQKNIEKISVREICEKAGYNRSTFYQHFKDIYDLRDFICEKIIFHVKENFLINITNENFDESFIESVTKIQTDKAKYFDNVLSAENRGIFTEKLIKAIKPIFLKKFDISAEEKFSDYIVEIYFNTMLTIISKWINSGRNLPIKDISNFILEILVKGVLKK